MTDESEESCSLKSMLEWKLDMIAYYVINDVWGNSRTDIGQALKIIEECYKEESTLSLLEINAIQDKIGKLEKRKRSLLDMRADGEITKTEYTAKRDEYEMEINKLNVSITEAETNQIASSDYNKKISSIKLAMEEILDLSQPKLNRDIVDGFVWKLVHISDNEFELYLSMGNESFGDVGTEEKIIKYKVFESANPRREERVKCTKLKSIQLTYDDAVSYRAMSDKRVLKNKWENLVVNIYI